MKSKPQIKYITDLKTFCSSSITKLAGSDLQGINHIIGMVTQNSTFYWESAQMLVDILDLVMERASEDAVSIYSLNQLRLGSC